MEGQGYRLVIHCPRLVLEVWASLGADRRLVAEVRGLGAPVHWKGTYCLLMCTDGSMGLELITAAGSSLVSFEDADVLIDSLCLALLDLPLRLHHRRCAEATHLYINLKDRRKC